MSEYIIDKDTLISEGDVETKVILPLLTNREPIGLGVHRNNIQSKNSLKKLLLDKGDKSIRYYPDFIVNVEGIPTLVIEAKKVGENLENAFREASLYAGEINRLFKASVNPCQYIIACDGENLLAGTWDSKDPAFDIPVAEWLPTSEVFIISLINLALIA